MKLNQKCIKDILTAIEETTTFTQSFGISQYEKDYNDLPEILKNYSLDELLYHFRQCDHSGFFIKGSSKAQFIYVIADLSPLGHEYLAKSRGEEWN